MKAITHLEKVIAGEVSAVTHLEKVIAQETTAVTYTEKVIAGEAPPVTHLQKVIAGEARPVTHLEYVWAGGSPASVQEYTGAVPVTFVADGTPLLGYLISGNTVQSGTPTSDNPIMPQGTGERTGNLAYGRIENANISSDGTMVRTIGYNVAIARVEVGKVYTANSYVLAFYTDEPTIGSVSYNSSRIVAIAGQPTTVTAPITGYVAFRLNIGEQAMFNSGSTPLPYEPYGYKIPISSANTTTPVYLGEVQTTRKIKKLVLTGEETNWYYYENATGTVKFFYLVIVRVAGIDLTGLPNTHGYSTHEITQQSGNTLIRIYAASDSVGNIEEWNSYLQQQYTAGTPVTVWYVLATEETAVVNEPLMRIGDYADTLSMEQAGVSIPTANGSTTLDVDTTVKPSEIYIKYRGEAVATLSMLSAEVSSPEATEEVNPEETEEEENGSEDISLQHEFEAIE